MTSTKIEAREVRIVSVSDMTVELMIGCLGGRLTRRTTTAPRAVLAKLSGQDVTTPLQVRTRCGSVIAVQLIEDGKFYSLSVPA